MLIETSFRKDLPRNATRALPVPPHLSARPSHLLVTQPRQRCVVVASLFSPLLCCCCLCFFFLLAVIFVVNILIKCRHRTLTPTATQSRRSFELTRGRCIYRDQDRAQPGHGLRHGLAALARTRLPFPRISPSFSLSLAGLQLKMKHTQCQNAQQTTHTHTAFCQGLHFVSNTEIGEPQARSPKKTTTQKKSPESQSELDVDSESDVRGRSHANSSLNFAQSQKFKTPNQTGFLGSLKSLPYKVGICSKWKTCWSSRRRIFKISTGVRVSKLNIIV